MDPRKIIPLHGWKPKDNSPAAHSEKLRNVRKEKRKEIERLAAELEGIEKRYAELGRDPQELDLWPQRRKQLIAMPLLTLFVGILYAVICGQSMERFLEPLYPLGYAILSGVLGALFVALIMAAIFICMWIFPFPTAGNSGPFEAYKLSNQYAHAYKHRYLARIGIVGPTGEVKEMGTWRKRFRRKKPKK